MTQPWESTARAVFGSSSRFELGAWIAFRRDETFARTDYSKETGRYRESTVASDPYQRFVQAGMLEDLGRVGRDRCYRRLEHPLWDTFRVAAGALEIPESVMPWQESLLDDLLAVKERLST